MQHIKCQLKVTYQFRYPRPFLLTEVCCAGFSHVWYMLLNRHLVLYPSQGVGVWCLIGHLLVFRSKVCMRACFKHLKHVSHSKGSSRTQHLCSFQMLFLVGDSSHPMGDDHASAAFCWQFESLPFETASSICPQTHHICTLPRSCSAL